MRIILLLVSADFLASEAYTGDQMKQAWKRHEAGLALLIPIVVCPCDWQRLPIGKLQALPMDGKPVSV